MATVPLAEIYEVAIATLRTGGLGLKWYEIDMGQLEMEGESLPLQYPAVLLKLGDVIWRDKGLIQIGEVTLTVKVIFQFQKEAEILIEGTVRTEVTENLILLETIHQSITGMTGSTFNQFIRFNQYHLSTKPFDLLWIHVMQYQCNIHSDASTPAPALDVDYINLKDNNSFMERRKFNLIHK
ncbi:MAG: hypothetical protein ACHQNT_02070 [Bacteroidia bacterium]